MPKPEKSVSVVRNRVRPDKIDEYLTWQKQMTVAGEQFEGYVNATTIEPGLLTQDQDEYIVIYKFTNHKLMTNWKNSSIRKELLEHLKGLSIDDPTMKTFTGLEHWFLSPDRTPSRIKMTIVSFFAIWPLVHFIPSQLSQILHFPALVNEAITTAVITICMSYIALPVLTKILKHWLK